MNKSRIAILFLLLIYTGFVYAQVYYRTDKLWLNTTSNNEMAPTIYKNGIVFSSNKKDDIILVTVDQEGGFMYNLYFAEKKGYRNWGLSKAFAEELSSRYNESSAAFSADWNTIYYTANIGGDDKASDRINDDTLTNGIFISDWNGTKWSKPNAFRYNSNDYDCGYPSITKDGNRLYFASNMPGGYGKFDIYYCDKTNSGWSKPVNIGAEINTSESEVFPFIHVNSRLYFSSGGHEGQGKLDIFYSDYIDGKWQNPVNLPRPFNSRSDDFAFVGNAELDTGYFTTNRRGSDDIYSFASLFPGFKECPEQIEESFCYEFYESGSMDLDTTSLRYEWDFGDGTKIRDTRVSHCFKEPGYYLVQMNVIDTLTGDVYFSEATYDMHVEAVVQPYILKPDTAEVSQNITLDASLSNIEDFTPENYYWDLGDGTIESEQVVKHRYAKPGTYNIRLGITGKSEEQPGVVQKACSSKKIIVTQRR